MLRTCSAILFLFTFISSGLAQSIYEQSDILEYTFMFQPYERTTNNKVLNQLALAQLKIPEKTSFIFHYKYKLSIGFSNDDQLHVFLDITPLGIDGHKQLRDFDLEPLLIPSEFSVSYVVMGPDRKIIIKSREKVVTDDGIVRLTSFPDSLWQNGTTAELEVFDIQFTESDYRKLELELFAIRDYYAAAALTDTITSRIQKVRKASPEFYSAVSSYITGLKTMYLLGQSVNTTTVTVPGNDPMRLKAKNGIALYTLKEYLEYIKAGHKTPLHGDLYLNFAHAYMLSMIDAEKLSRSVDYYSSPFFYRLYTNSFSSAQLIEAAAFIQKELLQRGYSPMDEKRIMQKLLQSYLKRSKELCASGKYLEAVDLLSGAVRMLSIAPTGTGNLLLSTELEKARSGLIYSYTEIVQKALDKGLTSLADKYLSEVMIYTEKYNIINDAKGPFRMLYARLADLKIQYGHKYLDQHAYQSALNEFTSALSLIEDNDGPVKERASNGQIMAVRAMYSLYLEEVKALAFKNNYQEASDKLHDAERFAAQYPGFHPDKETISQLQRDIYGIRYQWIKDRLAFNQNEITKLEIAYLAECYELIDIMQPWQDDHLDSLSLNIGLPYIQKLFSKARLKYWASEADSALFYGNMANDVANKLRLNYLEIVKEQHEKLILMVKETYCSQATGDFTSLLNQAEAFFRENKYQPGLLKTAEARELVYEKSNCALTTQPINQLLHKYEHPLRWDKLVHEAFQNLQPGKYIEAANLIWQAESLHSFYRLDTLGIANIGYFDIAMKSDNTEMLRHAFSNELSKGNPERAFKLLERLRQLGYSAEASTDLQETIGRILAQRDIAETPYLNAKVMLNTYTSGNKWYAKFETVYRYYTRNRN